MTNSNRWTGRAICHRGIAIFFLHLVTGLSDLISKVAAISAISSHDRPSNRPGWTIEARAEHVTHVLLCQRGLPHVKPVECQTSSLALVGGREPSDAYLGQPRPLSAAVARKGCLRLEDVCTYAFDAARLCMRSGWINPSVRVGRRRIFDARHATRCNYASTSLDFPRFGRRPQHHFRQTGNGIDESLCAFFYYAVLVVYSSERLAFVLDIEHG